MKIELTKAGFVHDGTLDDYIAKEKDVLCANSLTGDEDIDNETRQSLGLFDTLNGVAPQGMGNILAQIGANTVMPFGNPYTTAPVNVQPTGNGMKVAHPVTNPSNSCDPNCTNQNCKCGDKQADEIASDIMSDIDDQLIEEMDETFEDYGTGTKLSEDDFIFSIMIDPNASNDVGEPEAIIGINPLSFWNNNSCQYDQAIEVVLRKKYPVLRAMGDRFEEPEEGTFDMLDSDDCMTAKHISTHDTVENLCKAGVKFKRAYQDFMSQKDTQTIESMIIQLGYSHLIII